MKDLLLNPLKTADLARLCDNLSIETTREIRTTQIREIDRRNNVPKEDFDMDIDKFCRRVYSVFPTQDEQPDEDILAMSVTLCVTRRILEKIARLCGTETEWVEETVSETTHQLNLELGDQKVVVYARWTTP